METSAGRAGTEKTFEVGGRAWGRFVALRWREGGILEGDATAREAAILEDEHSVREDEAARRGGGLDAATPEEEASADKGEASADADEGRFSLLANPESAAHLLSRAIPWQEDCLVALTGNVPEGAVEVFARRGLDARRW